MEYRTVVAHHQQAWLMKWD